MLVDSEVTLLLALLLALALACTLQRSASSEKKSGTRLLTNSGNFWCRAVGFIACRAKGGGAV